MCIICVLIQKGQLTPAEAKRALFERAQEPGVNLEHLREVYTDIASAEELRNKNDT